MNLVCCQNIEAIFVIKSDAGVVAYSGTDGSVHCFQVLSLSSRRLKSMKTFLYWWWSLESFSKSWSRKFIHYMWICLQCMIHPSKLANICVILSNICFWIMKEVRLTSVACLCVAANRESHNQRRRAISKTSLSLWSICCWLRARIHLHMLPKFGNCTQEAEILYRASTSFQARICSSKEQSIEGK